MLKKLSGFNLGEFFAIKVALELPQKFPQIHPSISRKKLDCHFSASGSVPNGINSGEFAKDKGSFVMEYVIR